MVEPPGATRRGGATPSSTRSTSGASPTRTATGSATWPASRARLPYLRDLGVDALWFNPWYPSPMADTGYDIADYRSIDPAFGTLEEAEQLIAEARALGIRTIVDIVPNHVSDQHPWFRAALASPAGSPERERFWFRPGTGADGELPPNGWQSIFGGSAWTRTADATGAPGEWYLHLFAPEQPDLNWTHPDVWAEHEDVLRFWFDRGVAGVRIDSAALLVKDPALAEETPESAPGEHPFIDRDQLHEIYRRWRAIADSYAEPRVLVGEVWLPDAERFARYLRPDELHTAFNFDFLACPWEPGPMRASIDVGARRARPGRRAGDLGALEPRRHAAGHALRPRRHVVRVRVEARRARRPTCERGTRRARAAALLAMALPGSMYVYQGEELGLPEVEDIPSERRQDPMWHPLRRRRPRPRRLPRPAALGGRPAAVRLQRRRGRPALARPARRLGAAHRRGAVRRTGARCSPSTAPACGSAATAPWARRRRPALAPVRRLRPRLRARRATSPASSTSARTRSSCRPAPTSCIASDELEGGALPQDTTVWLRQANGSGIRRSRSTPTGIGHRPGAQERSRTMKSTRMATTARRHRGEPAALCAPARSRARRAGASRSRSASRR